MHTLEQKAASAANLVVNAVAADCDRRLMADSLAKRRFSDTAAAARHAPPERFQDRVAAQMQCELSNDKNLNSAAVGDAPDDFLCDVSNPDNRAAAV